MLIVHHLQKSQSERIVWLCEELGIPYELKIHKRDTQTLMAPPELAALSPTETAPVIQDEAITLGETGAIVEYILNRHAPAGAASSGLSVAPSAPNYPDYLYFLHFGNGYLLPAIGRYGGVLRSGVAPAPDDPAAAWAKRSFEKALRILDERLARSTWLAGDHFTAADVMCVYPLTTMRLYAPYGLDGYDAILAYLKRVAERDGFKAAMEKGDEGFRPLLDAAAPKSGLWK